MKTSELLPHGLLLSFALFCGCATTVSKEDMQAKTASIKKLAVVSMLDEGINVHHVTMLSMFEEMSLAPVQGYKINGKVEQMIAGRLRGKIETVIRPQDRERLVEFKQLKYMAYPDYNENLKPYLDELRSREQIDALLIIAPYRHVVLDRPIDPITLNCKVPLAGHGIYSSWVGEATYFACTASLYSTDISDKQMFRMKPRVWRPCKIAPWPIKGPFKGTVKFTDFSEEQQKFSLSELDKLIQEELPKNLANLGL